MFMLVSYCVAGHNEMHDATKVSLATDTSQVNNSPTQNILEKGGLCQIDLFLKDH